LKLGALFFSSEGFFPYFCHKKYNGWGKGGFITTQDLIRLNVEDFLSLHPFLSIIFSKIVNTIPIPKKVMDLWIGN